MKPKEPLLKFLVFLANKYQLGRQLSRNKGRVKGEDLITGRFLGQGCSGIFYETIWSASLESKARLARKDFPGVKGDVFESEVIPLFELHDHPNVVKTLCWTVDNRSCSLVMEYMKDDLSSVMRRKKEALRKIEHNQPVAGTSSAPFELLEAMNIALQIATGVEYLHDNGIIHGDLKPNNVLIDWKEGQMLVKMADFGLIETKRRTTLISQRAVCFRMIEWSAPEVFEASFVSMGEDLDYIWATSPKEHSDGSASSATDLDKKTMMKLADSYGFALTCAYILGGQLWSTKLSPNELREKISSPVLSPGSRPDLPFEYPEKLASLISKCWDPDPKCRPTFSIICNELQEIIKEQQKQEKQGEMRKMLQDMLQEQRELEMQRQETLRDFRQEIVQEKEKLEEALQDVPDSEKDMKEKLQDICNKLQEMVKVVLDFTADYSSLKPRKLETLNSPIPEAFDADSSKMVYPDLDPGALLRKGKALLSANIEPKESIPSILTTEEQKTYNSYHHQTQLEPWQPRKRQHGQYSSAAMDDNFDVFLNHRGPDVKAGFVAHLDEALRTAGLNPFLDRKSLKGDSIRSIDKALKEAKVYVAVISRGYARSEYCLRELVTMLRSGKPVVPVFYDVKPLEMRGVGRGPFAAAFERHKSRETPEQVEEWRDALRNLADINGLCFRLSDYQDEGELKWEVVNAILSLIPPMVALQVGCHLVGVEDQLNICVNELKKLEKMPGAVGLLGLVGMGGVGKTVLAKEIYNHFVGYQKFQAMSFLEIDHNLPSSRKVEQSLIRKLQDQLLWDLLSITNNKLGLYRYWFPKISSRGPVLIVLDGIYNESLFDQLVLDSSLLATGSCIIVTSRDRHLLKHIAGESSFYLHEVTQLRCDDSQKLFNWHAFGNEEAPEDFKALANDVSKACDGLPLALKVVGSSLFGKTSDEDREYIWLEAIEALRTDSSIVTSLKWSYDNLSELEKLMFVDIATVFNGWRKKEVFEVWKSCRKCSCCYSTMPLTSLRYLVDKSLVIIGNLEGDDTLAMHSLLRDIGQSIGNSSGSHLTSDRAINAVLENKFQGANQVRALNFKNVEKHFDIDAENLAKMSNLHFLVLDGHHLKGNFENIPKELRWLQLRCMPMTYLPPMSNLLNLVSLDISMSTVFAIAESTFEGCPNLLRLDTSRCTSITTLPDSIGRLSRLKALDLHDCGNLQMLPDSIGHLTSLELLNLQGCRSLEALPDAITALAWLQRLHMEWCSSLSKLPLGIGSLMTGLTSLSIDLATKEQAAGVGQVNALKHLTAMQCTDEAINVVDSSDALRKMDQLVELNFSYCKSITKLPDTIGLLTNLEKLCLFSCEGLEELPSSIGLLRALRILDLRECSNLMTLPESLGELTSLEYLSVVQCATLTKLPRLTMEGCGQLQLLPDSLSQLNELQFLQILDCGTMQGLGVLQVLQGLRIWGCTSITELPGSCLIVLDSNFWDPSWYSDVAEYSTVVRRNLKEVRVVEVNDSGFLRFARDDQTGRLILQRVHTSHRRRLAVQNIEAFPSLKAA